MCQDSGRRADPPVRPYGWFSSKIHPFLGHSISTILVEKENIPVDKSAFDKRR